jgi:hypothetical protein
MLFLVATASLRMTWAQPQPEPPDIMLEFTEELLNDLPYRVSALNDSGTDSPACVASLPSFEICHTASLFRCLPFADPSNVPVPLIACESKIGGSSDRKLILLPSGPAVPWRWWVSKWGFTITPSGVDFHASVEAEVDSIRTTIVRDGPVAIEFDKQSNSLRLAPSLSELVPLKTTAGCTVTSVDIAKLFSFAIPLNLEPLPMRLPGHLFGSAVDVSVSSVEPNYEDGKLRLDIDLAFQ